MSSMNKEHDTPTKRPFRGEEFSHVQFVLMDVEGTTTDIDFVKRELFPFSARELKNYVTNCPPESKDLVKDCLSKVAQEIKNENQQAIIDQLLKWIREDVKHPALKTLQGLIWQGGYKSGELVAPIYADVLPAWKAWAAAKIRLGIYSSGSVAAQKLLFGHTAYGNLLPMLEAHFDLDMGGKREATSYKKIADKLKLAGQQILFLSDIPEELDAARAADFCVAHIVRNPSVNSGTASDYKPYRTFTEI